MCEASEHGAPPPGQQGGTFFGGDSYPRRVLASLNHPNIAQIHGHEESEGTRALVLELVEGPTLADRIAQGPIPVDEALPIAKQIAEALEAAHEAGVIHRDLKPANIKVREDGTVKVLDFGLAKAFQPDASDPNLSQSPTISLTAAATQMGMVIGTASYMAPEQAKGKVVDKRADVWAFGAVLYEILTGRKPFVGDDVSTTLARVIEREPDWGALPSNLSPLLAAYLRRCLAKEPKQRIHDIADVRLAVEGAFDLMESPSDERGASVQRRSWAGPFAALVTLAAIAGLAVWALRGPASERAQPVLRMAIPAPERPVSGSQSRRILALSADGTTLVYSGGESRQLHARRLDQTGSIPLDDTEGAKDPFVSPDGAWVGFVTQGAQSIRKASLVGEATIAVAEAPNTIHGGTWASDGSIVFCVAGMGLFRVREGGGEPEPLEVRDLPGCYAPSLIADANAVVLVTDPVRVLTTGEGPLAVVDLNTEALRPLGLVGTWPRYVETGHLVYATASGELRAVPFDADSLEIVGTPVQVMEGVNHHWISQLRSVRGWTACLFAWARQSGRRVNPSLGRSSGTGRIAQCPAPLLFVSASLA